MKRLLIYIHGKGGNAGEAEQYKDLFPEYEVLGFDYQGDTPWDTKEEFVQMYRDIEEHCESITIIANSIGAYFTMNVLPDSNIEKAFFISPIVDMEKLILDMMLWANVSEERLQKEGEIATDFGETLSWNYLEYVRKHPITWQIPTHILYGEKDHLQSIDTVRAFAKKYQASLTVMPDGEHWFHTEEQMTFLRKWIRSQTQQERLKDTAQQK